MVTANGSMEGASFGPAGKGALGVRKGQAKNEKNALKSRRHRARKKVGLECHRLGDMSASSGVVVAFSLHDVASLEGQ